MPLISTLAGASSRGFGGLRTFGSVTPSAFESIATTTISSATSSIEFTSIPSTYTHLQVRAHMVCSATNNMYMQLGNGTIDTGSNYSWKQLWGESTNANCNDGQGQGFIYTGYVANSSYPAALIIDIADYANTNKHKTAKTMCANNNNTAGFVVHFSGRWGSSSAVDRLKITTGGGTFNQYSHFALYGIKNV
jgi:hypothetical protein